MSELVTDAKNFLETRADGGRKLLRRCLATAFTVSPDAEGGWTFSGEGRFMPSDLSRLIRHEATDNPHFDQRRIQGRVNAGRNSDPPEVVPPARHAQSWSEPLPVTLHGRVMSGVSKVARLLLDSAQPVRRTPMDSTRRPLAPYSRARAQR
jgi:hypothetical protein